ncbi:unnamed protein product [Thelazia callipaeda]|uniref:Histone-lysine N-methyltransferase CG1716 n=1 Tax=Thelazia callipaeda TaxID=103827 RepID=A0A0N5CQZ0_THECL|nr:unnamed protein product [Thelazia callipaeda]
MDLKTAKNSKNLFTSDKNINTSKKEKTDSTRNHSNVKNEMNSSRKNISTRNANNLTTTSTRFLASSNNANPIKKPEMKATSKLKSKIIEKRIPEETMEKKNPSITMCKKSSELTNKKEQKNITNLKLDEKKSVVKVALSSVTVTRRNQASKDRISQKAEDRISSQKRNNCNEKKQVVLGTANPKSFFATTRLIQNKPQEMHNSIEFQPNTEVKDDFDKLESEENKLESEVLKDCVGEKQEMKPEMIEMQRIGMKPMVWIETLIPVYEHTWNFYQPVEKNRSKLKIEEVDETKLVTSECNMESIISSSNNENNSVETVHAIIETAAEAAVVESTSQILKDGELLCVESTSSLKAVNEDEILKLTANQYESILPSSKTNKYQTEVTETLNLEMAKVENSNLSCSETVFGAENIKIVHLSIRQQVFEFVSLSNKNKELNSEFVSLSSGKAVLSESDHIITQEEIEPVTSVIQVEANTSQFIPAQEELSASQPISFKANNTSESFTSPIQDETNVTELVSKSVKDECMSSVMKDIKISKFIPFGAENLVVLESVPSLILEKVETARSAATAEIEVSDFALETDERKFVLLESKTSESQILTPPTSADNNISKLVPSTMKEMIKVGESVSESAQEKFVPPTEQKTIFPKLVPPDIEYAAEVPKLISETSQEKFILSKSTLPLAKKTKFLKSVSVPVLDGVLLRLSAKNEAKIPRSAPASVQSKHMLHEFPPSIAKDTEVPECITIQKELDQEKSLLSVSDSSESKETKFSESSPLFIQEKCKTSESFSKLLQNEFTPSVARKTEISRSISLSDQEAIESILISNPDDYVPIDDTIPLFPKKAEVFESNSVPFEDQSMLSESALFMETQISELIPSMIRSQVKSPESAFPLAVKEAIEVPDLVMTQKTDDSLFAKSVLPITRETEIPKLIQSQAEHEEEWLESVLEPAEDESKLSKLVSAVTQDAEISKLLPLAIQNKVEVLESVRTHAQDEPTLSESAPSVTGEVEVHEFNLPTIQNSSEITDFDLTSIRDESGFSRSVPSIMRETCVPGLALPPLEDKDVSVQEETLICESAFPPSQISQLFDDMELGKWPYETGNWDVSDSNTTYLENLKSEGGYEAHLESLIMESAVTEKPYTEQSTQGRESIETVNTFAVETEAKKRRGRGRGRRRGTGEFRGRYRPRSGQQMGGLYSDTQDYCDGGNSRRQYQTSSSPNYYNYPEHEHEECLNQQLSNSSNYYPYRQYQTSGYHNQQRHHNQGGPSDESNQRYSGEARGMELKMMSNLRRRLLIQILITLLLISTVHFFRFLYRI